MATVADELRAKIDALFARVAQLETNATLTRAVVDKLVRDTTEDASLNAEVPATAPAPQPPKLLQPQMPRLQRAEDLKRHRAIVRAYRNLKAAHPDWEDCDIAVEVSKLPDLGVLHTVRRILRKHGIVMKNKQPSSLTPDEQEAVIDLAAEMHAANPSLYLSAIVQQIIEQLKLRCSQTHAFNVVREGFVARKIPFSLRSTQPRAI